MAKPLGRGLESLIPQNPEETNLPARHLADDILSYQESLEEPVHGIRFASETLAVLPELKPKIITAEERIAPPSTMPKTEKLVSVLPVDKTEARPPRQGESIFWIGIEKIEPNPYQPRREFETEALQSLADSIKNHGVLQPLIASKVETETPRGISVKYQLISGERRWRASQLAGLREVPVIIKKDHLQDRLKLELALIENVQREDLNPVERAVAFKQLTNEFRLTQREIGSKIGKSREYVANTVRLLTLPKEVQEMIRSNRLSEGHGRALLMLSSTPDKQRELLDEIGRDKISVREAELAARALIGHRRVPQRKDVTQLDLSAREWQRQLEDALGTRVSLVKLDGGKGKIIVEFYSEEEFQNLIDRMIKEV